MLLDIERVAAPEEPVLSLAQIKAQCRVDAEFALDDVILEDKVAAATESLDGYEGELGRALVEQTWVLYRRTFPVGALRLPLPPLIAIESITYIDADGVGGTLDPSLYAVKTGRRAEVTIKRTANLPALADDDRALAITFSCGYGGAADVPAGIRSLVALIAADLYANREAQAVDVLQSNPAVKRLASLNRLPRV